MAIINEGTIAKLRRLAASWQVFNIKMHQYHYNVVGETFDELHKLFKELYEEADAHYDAVAERLRQIGERVLVRRPRRTKCRERREQREYAAGNAARYDRCLRCVVVAANGDLV